MIMFSGKVTFLGFFRLVYRIKVAGLPCQSRRFTVSKSPVYRVEIVAGLPCQSRRVTDLPCRSRQFAVSKSFSVSKLPVCRVKVTGLPCRNCHQFLLYRNHRFTVSKSPVCRFEVAESPVCRVEVTGENEIKSDENKKKHLQIKSKIKIKKAYVYKSYLCYVTHALIKTFASLISVKF